MNRGLWILGGCVLALAAASALVLIRTQDPVPSAPDSVGSGNAAVGASGETIVVTYTDAGFSPPESTISPGTTITWTNESSHPMQVHAHGEEGEGCDTGPSAAVFDQCTAVERGGTYSHTFTRPGTYGYHNHDRDEDSGTVVVTEVPSTGTLNPDAVPQ